ncbi:hypothetical protein EPA93_14140 [Ktedonosporobacter rubrisoli]|uniref:YCII-related domain-containing protein n=1 Tax=Ktedonosporobacter rubrisoli TaxID=2509675 RepID=A0A4P6JPR5_KTERU|nr:YciI family protein [Ktedonosporobacter rubrisoli]QBD77082.1 hypothetical protein EPA93_14140 [Ktedonosporobacter rubrisoli]
MQFLVIARDGDDHEALQRRLAAREAHLALVEQMAKAAQHLYAAALLNDAGNMIGSVMICEFPSRDELDAWLAQEPYVKGNVWKQIEVIPCQVGPAFLRAKEV